ncbi:MAG: glycoside hydrolase family 25 protein [Oscillospiraceae bacterium]|nr:glycoside hydrolase family 25 protein [Oscillospiraceae bacterium]
MTEKDLLEAFDGKQDKDKEKKKKKISRHAVFVFLSIAEAVVVLILAASLISAVRKNRDYELYIAAMATDVDEYEAKEDDSSEHKEIPLCTYDLSRLTKRGGFMYYEGDDAASKVGIDVSYFQGDIDWEKVKESGVDFAMIRIGYRGYESGAIKLDKKFDEYMTGAAEAGIDTGVYFFSQAVSESEAASEAEFVISHLRGYDVTYPVVFDWEIIGEESARTNDIPVRILTDCTVRFCSDIASAGYTPMIYTNTRQALVHIDMSELTEYDIWLAEYDDKPSYPYDFKIWQYASDAIIPGIENEVDVNISFVDYSHSDDENDNEENTSQADKSE